MLLKLAAVARRSRASLLAASFLIVALAGTTAAGTGVGAVFNLGRTNTVNALSSLAGSTTRLLQITNTSGSTAAVAVGIRSYFGTPLQLVAGAGKPPMTVNSSVKVANLNADKLDGLDSTQFVRPGSATWHEVGAAGEPAFVAGWSNTGTGNGLSGTGRSYSTAGFFKDAFGIVHLKGNVEVTSISDTVVFQLPAGYAPAHDAVFPAVTNFCSGAFIVVGTLGHVQAICNGGYPPDRLLWALDGMTFPAG